MELNSIHSVPALASSSVMLSTMVLLADADRISTAKSWLWSFLQHGKGPLKSMQGESGTLLPRSFLAAVFSVCKEPARLVLTEPGVARQN